MKARLVDSLSGGDCCPCGHTVGEFGPYLATDLLDHRGRLVVLCASDVATLAAPLDLVPASKLVDSQKLAQRAEEAILHAGEVNVLNETLAARVKQLDDMLAQTRSERDSFERQLADLAGKPALERRKQLLDLVREGTQSEHGRPQRSRARTLKGH